MRHLTVTFYFAKPQIFALLRVKPFWCIRLYISAHLELNKGEKCTNLELVNNEYLGGSKTCLGKGEANMESR